MKRALHPLRRRSRVEHTLGYFTPRNQVQVKLLQVSAPLWVPPEWAIGSFVQGCLRHLVITRLFMPVLPSRFHLLCPRLFLCCPNYPLQMEVCSISYHTRTSCHDLCVSIAAYAPFGFDNGSSSLDYSEWSIKLGFQRTFALFSF